MLHADDRKRAYEGGVQLFRPRSDCGRSRAREFYRFARRNRRALGLSLASGVPAVGISSFLTVAQVDPRERQDRRVFALLDSRRDEPFLVEIDEQMQFCPPPHGGIAG